MSPSNRTDDSSRGYIIPIGGAEEKLHNPEILDRFVEICGGMRLQILRDSGTTGDNNRARDLLALLFCWFTEEFDRVDLNAAKVLPHNLV